MVEAATAVIPTGAFDPEVFDLSAFLAADEHLLIPLDGWQFATRHLETSPPYFARILNAPRIDRSLIDTFWGVTEATDFSVELDNSDGLFNPLYTYDPRGKPITLSRYDYFSNTVIEAIHATITKLDLEPGKLILRARTPDLTPFDQPVPSVVLDVDNFSKRVVDIGAVIPAVFGGGLVRKVPLVFARDAVNANRYDFIVGHGTLEVIQVYRDGPDGTFVPVRAPDYEVSTTIFPGYTTIRFRVRPVNFSGSFYKYFADVRFLNGSRNFAFFIKEVISNTVWGLGRAVNDASFTAAAAILDAIGDLFCDVALTEKRPAQDWLRQALMVRGMRLSQNAVGEWEITVDTERTTAKMHVSDGPGDGPRTLLSADARGKASLDQAIKIFKLHYARDHATGEFRFTQQRTVHADFGQDKDEENELITNHVTADKVTDYLSKRHKFGEDRVKLTLPQEGRKVILGDLVLVTYAPLNITDEYREVAMYTKGIDTVEIEAIGWDASIYVYTPGTLPTDPDEAPLDGRIPRPGGLELMGTPRFEECTFNPARARAIGLGNWPEFRGRTVRFRWHAIAELPLRGLDEDNLNRGETLIRDYVITIRGYRMVSVDSVPSEEEE